MTVQTSKQIMQNASAVDIFQHIFPANNPRWLDPPMEKKSSDW